VRGAARGHQHRTGRVEHGRHLLAGGGVAPTAHRTAHQRGPPAGGMVPWLFRFNPPTRTPTHHTSSHRTSYNSTSSAPGSGWGSSVWTVWRGWSSTP
jgi:hypothetical protein